MSTYNEEYREQEINLENLIVEDTPPNLGICDEVNREPETNLENLIVEETPTNLSIDVEVGREQESDAEKQTVDDTHPNSSLCDVRFHSALFFGFNLIGMHIKIFCIESINNNYHIIKKVLSHTR